MTAFFMSPIQELSRYFPAYLFLCSPSLNHQTTHVACFWGKTLGHQFPLVYSVLDQQAQRTIYPVFPQISAKKWPQMTLQGQPLLLTGERAKLPSQMSQPRLLSEESPISVSRIPVYQRWHMFNCKSKTCLSKLCQKYYALQQNLFRSLGHWVPELRNPHVHCHLFHISHSPALCIQRNCPPTAISILYEVHRV